MATNSITYIQLINIFEDFKTRHYQLNSFYHGDISELGDSQSFIYPLLGVIPSNVQFIKDDGDYYSNMSYTFNIIFADIVKRDDENETQVRSETLQITMDFIAELDQHPFLINNNISLINNLQLDPFTERWGDLLTGWVLQLNILTPFDTTYCIAPQEQIINDDDEIITRCDVTE